MGDANREPVPVASRLGLDRFRYQPDACETVTTKAAMDTSAGPPARSKRACTTASPYFRADTPETGTSTVAPPGSQKAVKRRTAVRKRSLQTSRHAPNATYAHLPLLPDALAPNLIVLFCGLNPGIETARSGHAYAHPSNLFWKLMYSSGVLPERCRPDEDQTLPARFRLGLTNIVARPTRNGAELKNGELDAGVAVLDRKARRWRPLAMCFVGKGIWDSIVRVRVRQGHAKPATFHYGWQDESWNMGVIAPDDEDDTVEGVVADPTWTGARVFVASSTSGLAAGLRPAEKEAIWRQLGEWVEQKREETANDHTKRTTTTNEDESGEDQGMQIQVGMLESSSNFKR